MQLLIKYSLFFLILMAFLNATTLEEKAYNAYKSKNYKLAFKLYTKAAKNKDSKAILMLGVFFEKGLSIPKDTNRAKKLYKYVIKDITKNYLQDKNKIDIAIVAAKRLLYLTNKNKYKVLINKLQLLKDKIDSSFYIEDKNLNLDIIEYYSICVNAKVIPLEFAEGITEFDCTLFEKFPQQMKKFMKLKKVREITIELNQKELTKIIDRKITYIIKPMIKFIQQDTIKCYDSAVYNSDIKACDYDYLLKTDPLLFSNAAFVMERLLSSKPYKEYKLDLYEKEKLIKKLIEKFNNKTFRKEYNHIVKLY